VKQFLFPFYVHSPFFGFLLDKWLDNSIVFILIPDFFDAISV